VAVEEAVAVAETAVGAVVEAGALGLRTEDQK
jgi:hypothetical protein